MAKVTDLNGCFISTKGDLDFIKAVIDITKPAVTTGWVTTPRAECIYFRDGATKLIVDFILIETGRDYKEIYFHNGEFYDKSLAVVDFLKSNLKFVDGDLYINSAGRVFEVSSKVGNPADLCNNPRAFDSDTCVLYSAWMESAKAESLLQEIPWTDGSIDEQEPSKVKYEDGMRKAMQNIARTCGRSFAVDIGYEDLPALVEKLMYENNCNSEWSNGDPCIHKNGFSFTFIGMCDHKGHDCLLLSESGTPTFSFVKEISKPETEAEKKTRENAEEVDRICFDLFGTPAFDCNQAIIDTVEKMVINGYKKGE